jgi:hypothetical protein
VHERVEVVDAAEVSGTSGCEEEVEIRLRALKWERQAQWPNRRLPWHNLPAETGSSHSIRGQVDTANDVLSMLL